MIKHATYGRLMVPISRYRDMGQWMKMKNHQTALEFFPPKGRKI
jgi:hypothetical protein